MAIALDSTDAPALVERTPVLDDTAYAAMATAVREALADLPAAWSASERE